MKTSILSVIITITSSTIAMANSATEKVILDCNSIGALDYVQLIEDSSTGAKIKIVSLEDETEPTLLSLVPSNSGQVTGTLNGIKAGKADTLIGTADKDNVYGGAYLDAALLRVGSGQTEAYLSYKGSVHILTCKSK